tara:strand:+ start:3499 stop:4389 length:891 start_codon:yes stop_codon:yes gene_type:complete
MAFKDTVMTILIFIIFFILICSSLFTAGLDNIKKDWNKYRCNPMVMPIAGYFGEDAMANFVYCVGGIQKGLMNVFTDPLYFNINLLGDIANNISNNINKGLSIIGNLDKFTSFVSLDIFNMLRNVVVEFQKILINIQDLFKKLVGVLVVIVRMTEGAAMSGSSIWRGPIGKTLREVCFHSDTPIELYNGTIVSIKDIKHGDQLKDNVEVLGTLRLKGTPSNTFFKLWSEDLQQYILVTGTHKILPNNAKDSFDNFINVQDYHLSKPTSRYSETLYCLITSTNRIHIGEHTFWDWED